MAATLDLQAVAEGVESLEQARRLEQLGSPLVQGFYYAQPLSADAATALMSTRRALGTAVKPTSAPAPTALR
jgi:EAL domain-containing protein (putative c-di-GMP-specific phosphodiesterase class I)